MRQSDSLRRDGMRCVQATAAAAAAAAAAERRRQQQSGGGGSSSSRVMIESVAYLNWHVIRMWIAKWLFQPKLAHRTKNNLAPCLFGSQMAIQQNDYTPIWSQIWQLSNCNLFRSKWQSGSQKMPIVSKVCQKWLPKVQIGNFENFDHIRSKGGCQKIKKWHSFEEIWQVVLCHMSHWWRCRDPKKLPKMTENGQFRKSKAKMAYAKSSLVALLSSVCAYNVVRWGTPVLSQNP